jgi:hypothetical protein
VTGQGETAGEDATALNAHAHVDSGAAAVMVIRTEVGGLNGGRSFFLRAQTGQDGVMWFDAIVQQVKIAKEAHVVHLALQGRSPFGRWLWKVRASVRRMQASPVSNAQKSSSHGLCISIHSLSIVHIYQALTFENLWQVFQSVIVLMICASFVLDVVEAELGPDDGSSMMHFFFICDWFFSCAFLAELSVNLFGYGKDYWGAPWNCVDMAIVLFCFACTVLRTGIQELKMLRLVKTFRIVRVFRNFKSANRIINALYGGNQ